MPPTDRLLAVLACAVFGTLVGCRPAGSDDPGPDGRPASGAGLVVHLDEHGRPTTPPPGERGEDDRARAFAGSERTPVVEDAPGGGEMIRLERRARSGAGPKDGGDPAGR